jgi:hypothetical protein|tara:strand:- start:255 stop:473 length:219 start_codon:yes stop_codon:yes gene_type:complete
MENKYSMTKQTYIFKQEDIFQDIPGDDENVNFTIPPEIMEAQGWVIGDPLKIEWGDQGTIRITKIEAIDENT